MARPSKLTDERLARLTQAIKMGASYELACKYAGISYQTLRNWLVSGEVATRGPLREVYEAVALAEGEAVLGWLAKIDEAAANGQWQAAAWKLERRYPQAFARVERHELSGEGGGPLTLIVERVAGRLPAPEADDA